MDPRTCLIETLEAILDAGRPNSGKYDDEAEVAEIRRGEAVEGLRNLADWLEGGGFVPSVASGDWDWPRQ